MFKLLQLQLNSSIVFAHNMLRFAQANSELDYQMKSVHDEETVGILG